jgi:hypothetical protein
VGSFTFEEYCDASAPKNIPIEFIDTAMELVRRVNAVRQVYGRPMIASSGFRSVSHNEKIGGAKKSTHCRGAAVDILDPTGSLADWVYRNEDVLEEIGLWVESPQYTEGWVHFQSSPPKSGRRIYIPL